MAEGKESEMRGLLLVERGEAMERHVVSTRGNFIVEGLVEGCRVRVRRRSKRWREVWCWILP